MPSNGLIGSVGWCWTSSIFYRWQKQYSSNINPAEMTRPKIELNLESPDIVRADDFVGGSLTLSSEVVGIMLGIIILLGLDVSIVDSGVGWLVGLSSIFGDGDTNLDIGNSDGYDEGCCFAIARSEDRIHLRQRSYPNQQSPERATLTYWHTAGSGDLVGEDAASAAVFSINVTNRRVVGGVILWPRRWCSCGNFFISFQIQIPIWNCTSSHCRNFNWNYCSQSSSEELRQTWKDRIPSLLPCCPRLSFLAKG